MRLGRPHLPRTESAPAPANGIAVPLREQTLRTLDMLKNMGYHDVWCKCGEVDAGTIEQALEKGWRVCDVAEGRIKFTLTPGTPITPGTALKRTPAIRDRYSRGSVRTTSPTRLTPEPGPSPLALYKRASANNASPPETEAAARAEAFVSWGRRPSADPPPAVVVSPPPDDGVTDDDELGEEGADYFTFVPVTRHHLDGWTPPTGSWLERRMAENASRPESVDSAYSRDSMADSPFEFDRTDPFAARPAYRPSPLGADSPRAIARQAFQPRTPELRLGAGRGRALQGAEERPTYTLNRMFSDPGNNSEPSFELLPLMPPSWRNRGS